MSCGGTMLDSYTSMLKSVIERSLWNAETFGIKIIKNLLAMRVIYTDNI
jgi:hypothetical protein